MADVIHLLAPRARAKDRGDPCQVLPLGEPLEEIRRQNPGRVLVIMDAYLPGRGVLIASGAHRWSAAVIRAIEDLNRFGMERRLLEGGDPES